jgi:hypothetical protein
MSRPKEDSTFLRLLDELEAAHEAEDQKRVEKIILFSQLYATSLEKTKKSREVRKEEHHE